MNYASATWCPCGRPSVAQGPSHARSVVSDPEAAVRAEQDDAAMTLEARMEIGDGVLGGLFRSQLRHPVDRPFAQHQLHDGLAPSGKRHGRAPVVGVAPTPNDRRIPDPSGGFVQSPSGGGGGGQVAVSVQRNRAHGVMRVGRHHRRRWTSGMPALARALAASRRCRSRSMHQLGVVDQG